MRAVKLSFLAALLVASLALGGCQALRVKGESTATVPNLSLLQMEEYREENQSELTAQTPQSNYYRIDLWLDASQNMGGINTIQKSVYPTPSKRYREGGFHYRVDGQKGWYEAVLGDMLAACEEKRVRVLRYGNERLSDAFLVEQDVAASSDEESTLRSLRRDMLTYSLAPTPGTFAGMMTEKVRDSFYALGSAQLNQMPNLNPGELENPSCAQKMDAALAEQIRRISAGEPQDMVADAVSDTVDCPLMYALQNMDASRLNVLVVDPTTLRDLTGATIEGEPVAYYAQAIKERGLLEGESRCVGLTALKLDYMGMLCSIGKARLAEPFLWGKLVYADQGRNVRYIGVMPRWALVLTIGEQEQVESFQQALSARLDADEALLGMRGPEKKSISYARNGETIFPGTFAFEYCQAIINRPQLGYYTQNTTGAALMVTQGQGEIAQSGEFYTALLSPDGKGTQESRSFEVRIPMSDDATLIDPARMSQASAAVLTTLLLTETEPNTAENQASAAQEQKLALRDTLYVYTRTENPFADAPSDAPFTVEKTAFSEGNDWLSITLRADGAKLKDGYYRLLVQANIDGSAIAWPTISWIDGDRSISAQITPEDVYQWENFTQTVLKWERRENVPRQLTHAWGSYNEKGYHGVPIPSCPPVDAAPGLAELTRQFRTCLEEAERPFVRYVFDVFVSNTAR